MEATEILTRAAPAALTFALGRAWPRLLVEVKARRAKRYWGPVARRSTVFVVGRHHQDDEEPGGLLGLGDVRTIRAINSHLRELFVAEPDVLFDDQLAGDDVLGDKTVIAIGGPYANRYTRGIWKRTGATWRFQDDHPGTFAVVDTIDGRMRRPERDADGAVRRDYALIIRMPSPVARRAGHHLFLFAGCYGYGTTAAARCATSDEFLDDARIDGADGIECLIGVDVADGVPHAWDLLEVRSLSSPPPSTSSDRRMRARSLRRRTPREHQHTA